MRKHQEYRRETPLLFIVADKVDGYVGLADDSYSSHGCFGYGNETQMVTVYPSIRSMDGLR